jgi:very-short-patch-repair endonuclease
MCTSCSLFSVGKKPYLCSYCNPISSNRQRTRENVVKVLLEENKIDFTHDRSTGVCGNFRPDFLIDCGTHFVVVECDEDQHKQYDRDCENTRMVNIQQSLGLYTVFIRYSPDPYKINNKTVPTTSKYRHKILLETIEKYRNTPLEKTMDVEYLFYDQ